MTASEIKLANHGATLKLGQELAIKWGTKPLLILLSGELGAGKTTLAQGFIQALVGTKSVLSPTYSYVKTYLTAPPSKLCLAHFDLYRIDSVEQLEELGLRESLCDAQTLRLVEWAERAPFLLPMADFIIELCEQDQTRIARITQTHK